MEGTLADKPIELEDRLDGKLVVLGKLAGKHVVPGSKTQQLELVPSSKLEPQLA